METSWTPFLTPVAWRLGCLVLLASCLLIGPGRAAAELVHDLYAAEVPVNDREQGSRQVAIRRALGVVAVKVSGRRDASALAAATAAGETPEGLVRQSAYREMVTPGAGPPALSVLVRFEPAPVDELLRGAGLPVWGRQRPTMLTWVGLDEATGKRIVSSDDGSGLGPVIRAAGRERGVPVVIPLMDLEDELRVSPSDVWAAYEGPLADASRRYATEVVLVARVSSPQEGAWSGGFELVLPDGGQRWSAGAAALRELLVAAVDEASERTAVRFAGLVVSGEPGVVQVRVSGVADLPAYARVLAYLESLDQVREVRVTGMAGDQLRLRLESAGGPEGLRRLTRFGVVLEPVDGGAANEVQLRLRP